MAGLLCVGRHFSLARQRHDLRNDALIGCYVIGLHMSLLFEFTFDDSNNILLCALEDIDSGIADRSLFSHLCRWYAARRICVTRMLEGATESVANLERLLNSI